MRDENYGPKTRYSCGRTVFVYCALIMRGLRAYGPYIEITHSGKNSSIPCGRKIINAFVPTRYLVINNNYQLLLSLKLFFFFSNFFFLPKFDMKSDRFRLRAEVFKYRISIENC